MAVIAVPATLRFEDFDISCDAVSDVMASPFNGRRQVAKQPFDQWNFEGRIVPLDPMDAGSLRSFFMQLAGRVNTFKLKIAGSKFPVSGYTGPNGNLVGAAVGYVQVNGLTASTVIVNEGDYFNIGNELKVATVTRSSDGSGVAYLYFMPPLRNTTAGQVVTLTDPFLHLHATRDDVARWKVTAPVRHAFKLDAEEEIE